MLPHVGPTSYRCCLPTLHHKSALHHTAGPTSYKQVLHHTAGPTSYKQVLHHTAGPTPYSRSYIIQVLPAHSAKNCTDLVCDSLLLHPISAFNHYAFTCDISSAPTLLLPNADRCTGTLLFCIPSWHSTNLLSLVLFQVHQHCCCQTQIVAPGLFFLCIPSRHSTIMLSLVLFQVHQQRCCQTQIVAPGLFCFASHLGIQPICFHLLKVPYAHGSTAPPQKELFHGQNVQQPP